MPEETPAMSEHLGDAAELLLEDPITQDDFAGALANGDLAALVRRALDPGDAALAVVGWPGRRLERPLARGDLVIHGARDAAPRLAVVGDSQLLDRASARRQALVTAAPLPGGYVRTIEPAGVAHGGRFARRLTGPDGLLLPGVTIVRAVGEDAETDSPHSPRPTIRQGSSGPAVADAQARLNALHAERTSAGQTGLARCPLTVDGRFGQNTHGAVVSFQRVAFPSAPNEWDGVVGPRTWAALGASEGETPVLPTRCPGLAPTEIIDHFDFNSSSVLPRHQPKIVGIARCVIESRRTPTPITTQTVIGHTDNVGSDSDNDSLGLRRAEAVKAEILAAIQRMTGAPARLAIATSTRGEREAVPGDAGASRRVEVITPVRVAPPPPARAATVQFVLDDDDDHLVDGRAPVATALMFGLWDQAYNAAGSVRNAAAETANFVGLDRRRFYLRVSDPGATGASVQAQWKTLTSAGADDDAPASLAVTLTETSSDDRRPSGR